MKWLETHKHLALALIIAVASLLLAFKIVAHLDGKAHDARVLAEAQLKQDQEAQKAKDLQAEKDRQAFDNLKAQLDLQNAALRSQITILTTALASRQAQDKTLPPSELADRWAGLIGALPGDVKPVPDGLIANLESSRKTVVALEEIPVARQTIGNQDKIIANDKQELASIQVAFNSAQAAVEACHKSQESKDLACEAEKKEIRATARKHGLWYSVAAFIAGAILGRRI